MRIVYRDGWSETFNHGDGELVWHIEGLNVPRWEIVEVYAL